MHKNCPSAFTENLKFPYASFTWNAPTTFESYNSNASDNLYDLKKEDLLALDRFAEKSATNLIEGIAASKKIPFEKVLFAIGIRYVGDTVAKKLALQFNNIENLQAADNAALVATPEIGEF